MDSPPLITTVLLLLGKSRKNKITGWSVCLNLILDHGILHLLYWNVDPDLTRFCSLKNSVGVSPKGTCPWHKETAGWAAVWTQRLWPLGGNRDQTQIKLFTVYHGKICFAFAFKMCSLECVWGCFCWHLYARKPYREISTVSPYCCHHCAMQTVLVMKSTLSTGNVVR